MLEQCELAAGIGSFRARVNRPPTIDEFVIWLSTDGRHRCGPEFAYHAPMETE